MRVKTVNLKENNSSADYAEFMLESEIVDAQSTDTDVIIAIHGYGSNGVGGVMKRQVTDFLAKQKKFKKIIEYFPGEKWGTANKTVQRMYKLYPDLIVNSQISSNNSGITVVWVKSYY